MNIKNHKFFRIIILILRDFAILAIMGNALSLITLPLDMWSVEIFCKNSILSFLIGYPAWKGIGFIGVLLDRKLPWLRNPVKRLIVQAVSMITYAMLIMGGGVLIWVGLSEEITIGMLNFMAYRSILIGLIFLILSLLVANTILFFKNWRTATIQQEELKRAHLALQYDSLKNQVKPHFLFNSLSSLVTLINTDTVKATEFVHKLADVYRYLLEQRDNELVKLSEELKFTEDYTFLQKIRFGENLRVNFDQKTDKNLLVLPLSLQMMIENAIKHNEISKDCPLIIDIISGDDNYIVVKNKLNRKNKVEDSLGLGLGNMEKRIAFFTDKPLLIEETGDYFTVKIPAVNFKV